MIVFGHVRPCLQFQRIFLEAPIGRYEQLTKRRITSIEHASKHSNSQIYRGLSRFTERNPMPTGVSEPMFHVHSTNKCNLICWRHQDP